MGLGVEVGILADLKDADEEGYAAFTGAFEQLNDILRSSGLSPYIEPDELDEIFSCDLLSYAGIHYLRRIAVHRALSERTPGPGTPEALRNVADLTQE